MAPGPAAPAPLSNSTRTNGVWAANSARAAVTRLVAGEPDGRERCLGRYAGGEGGELVEDGGGQGARFLRDLPGHVDVEEFEPPADRLRVGRVDVAAVDHVGVHRRGLRDGIDERRPLRAGLLVLEGAGEEDRDGDMAGPVDHGPAIEQRGIATRSGSGRHLLRSDQALEALGLVVEGLVGQTGRRGPPAGGQFGVDLVVGPRLADVADRSRRQLGQPSGAVGGRGHGVVDPGGDPAGREAAVVDAARDSRWRRGRRWGSSGRWRPDRADRCRPTGTATAPSS